MDFFTLYLIIMVSGLTKLFLIPAIIMAAIGLIMLIPFLILTSDSRLDEGELRILNLFKWLIPALLGVSFVMFAVSIFIPSWEQMKILIGGYYVTNIDGIETIPANMVDLINSFLTEMKPAAPE